MSRLYFDLVTRSTLAKAIAVLYNNIAASQVAHINLTDNVGISLQLPTPGSISSLPSPLASQLPGLWLSTAPLMVPEPEAQGPGSQLNAHFGLLLLSSTKSILDEISSSEDQTHFIELVAHYLRTSTPTKSFLQISQRSGLSLHHVQILAFHLIQWRKARAIPPLNQRDTYIVSPNADMHDLISASSAFAKAFPALPSLPKLLSLLSGTPKPYATLIPSRDHKETYMEILAWLLREGWVTQIRSFAWVRVPSHLMDSNGPTLLESQPTASNNISPIHQSSSTDRNVNANMDVLPRESSPHPDLQSPSLASSPQSITTAIHIPSRRPPQTDVGGVIIPNPRTATSTQQRHLSAITAHIRAKRGEESAIAWEACVTYLDGKTSLESVAVMMGWKKKKLAELVAAWEGEGVLLRGGHW